jgi:hypothetical protein
LRLWQAGPADNPTWRASLEDPHTHQVISFDTLKALCEHLAALDQQLDAGIDPESNPISRPHPREPR